MSELYRHRDIALEELLARYDISATLSDVALDHIDERVSSAHQVRSAGLDLDTVEHYAAALDRGDLFPAGLARGLPDGRYAVVGGAHRYEAHRRAGRTSIALYVVDEVHPDRLRHVAIEHNARHGLPLTAADRRRLAIVLVDGGASQTEAGAVVGMAPQGVSRALTVRDAAGRAQRSGLSALWTPMSYTAQYRLAAGTRHLTDPVFAEAVTTFTHCGRDVATAAAIADGLMSASTEEAGLAFLERYETANHRAGSRAGAGPPDAGRLRSAASQIVDLDPNRVAAQVAPSFAAATVGMIRRAATRLAECAIAIEREHPPAADR